MELNVKVCVDNYQMNNCFLFSFEKDFKNLFNLTSKELSLSLECDSFPIKVGLNGGLFISLRKYPPIFITELIKKLTNLIYIHKCNVNEYDILTFVYQKPLIIKYILSDIFNNGIYYGFGKVDRSYMIMVHDEAAVPFDLFRLSLVANQIASILTCFNAKVYVSNLKMYSDLIKLSKSVDVSCFEDCYQKMEDLKISCASSITEKAISRSNLGIDAELSDKLQNDVELKGILKASHIAHFYTYHENLTSLHSLKHVCLMSQTKVLKKAEVILNRINKTISCQSIHNLPSATKVYPEFNIILFVASIKKEITDAMIHKYGPNIINDPNWEKRINILTDTVVKFSFLKVPPSAPLKLESFCSKNISKNVGIFIQYNFARLSNLFKTFETKVEKGYYEPLSIINDTEFEILNKEEEWELLAYIMLFPKLMKEILDPLYCCSDTSNFSVNKIITMLNKLCHCLSRYYSRYRILGGSQHYLQKQMHVRLWLLKGIYQILQNSFMLLNIQGLDLM